MVNLKDICEVSYIKCTLTGVKYMTGKIATYEDANKFYELVKKKKTMENLNNGKKHILILLKLTAPKEFKKIKEYVICKRD